MKKMTILAMALGLGVAAHAQYFLRGSMNGWDTSAPFTLLSGTTYEASVTGLPPGTDYSFKMGNADWTDVQPSGFQNVRARSTAAGTLTCRFYDVPTPGDGWLPDSRRVGIVGVGTQYELIGAMTGWSFGIATTVSGDEETAYADLWGGTNNEFKFRGLGGDWAYNIGNDFAEAGNAVHFATHAGYHKFQLNVLEGKYRVTEGSTNLIGGNVNIGSYTGTIPNSDKVWLDVVVSQGGQAVMTTKVVLDAAQSNFNYGIVLPPSLTGSVDISFVGGTWIKRTISATIVPNSTVTADVTLPNGDIVDDGVVDIADYTALALAFDGTFGADPYTEASDLNKDGVIDIADYTILALGFDAADN